MIDHFNAMNNTNRICPFAASWNDHAVDTDLAHQSAECSDRGLCNRGTGHCECQTGFSGAACERFACPDDCSKHGVCFSMRDFAKRTRDKDSNSYTYTTVWDAEKVRGCKCDTNYHGYDCSLSTCPTGDDPLTVGQVNEIQLLKCTSNAGGFHLYYDGKPSTLIPWTANADDFKSALEAIQTLKQIKVTFSQGPTASVCQTTNPNIVSIEFEQDFGNISPLVASLNGQFDKYGGKVEISADGVTSFIDDQNNVLTSVKGTKENDICSN